MNDVSVSWIDVVSPVVTFLTVIVAPVFVALWVIYRTVTDPTPTDLADSDGSADDPDEVTAE